MHSTRKIKEDLIYVGGSDRRLSRFENLFPIPRGVSYNSYVLLDDKTVLMDTADESISRQYIENVVHALDGRPLDYMIVQHMEPDHCAMIDAIMSRYPEAKMVCTAKAAQMFAQFYDLDVSDRTLVVKEGDKLSTGLYIESPAFRARADGALAGGHGHLRRKGQDPVLCGRIRHVRCAGRQYFR